MSGNALNLLSLTDVLRIHHFHLDGALITELCRLLNNDLQSQITQPTSLCVTTAFVRPFHLSDRLCIGHSVRDVCMDISVHSLRLNKKLFSNQEQKVTVPFGIAV